MGIGASNEVLPEKEIKQEVKKERSRSKSKKGKKRSKSRTGRRSTKSKEKKAAKAGKEMERNTPEASGGTLEERGVLALERVAVSMEALVRMAMIAMMMKMVMESSIKVQIPNSDADQQYSAS